MTALTAADHLIWAPDPVFFRVGSLEIRYYGLLLALGISLTFVVWYRRARAYGESRRFAESWLLWVPPAVLIGGRLGHTLFYETSDFLAHPLILIQGRFGLSSHGVTIGGGLAAWGIAWQGRRRYLQVVDYSAPGVALGSCCIRLGNFMNSEIVGRPSDAPWAVVFSRYDSVPRHPVQLYEIGTLLIAFAAILIVERWDRRVVGTGMSIGVFLATYFGLRFFTEFFKERMKEQLRDPGRPLGALEHALDVHLTTGQWLSLLPAALGIVLIVHAARRPFIPITHQAGSS